MMFRFILSFLMAFRPDWVDAETITVASEKAEERTFIRGLAALYSPRDMAWIHIFWLCLSSLGRRAPMRAINWVRYFLCERQKNTTRGNSGSPIT